MSLIGKEIPEFKLQAYQTGEFLNIGKQDLLGGWNILFFYPEDFSAVCPTELAALQKEIAGFEALETRLWGCSTDTHESHKEWLETTSEISNVSYALLSDPEAKLTKWFDVLERDGKPQRATFLIDPNGVIQSMEVNAYGIGRKVPALFDKIKAAQYIAKNPGEACPAEWQEGGETVLTTLDLEGKI